MVFSQRSFPQCGSSQHSLIPLSDSDFDMVGEMARTACGISLHQGKRALVSSRLEWLVRVNGFDSFRGYLVFLAQRKTGPEFTEFIDTLTTNHTGFWREPEHFLFLLKTILPQHPTRLRVWSAACATGEEPYTIGMCALESGLANCRVVASDISRSALNAAVRGSYESARLHDLPAPWHERYFGPLRDGLRGIAPAVRGIVSFGPLNLMQPFGHIGNFDVIFCRNVMIYFEQQTRDELAARLAAQLAPGGHLFTGHSETLLRLPAGLQYVQPATYRKL